MTPKEAYEAAKLLFPDIIKLQKGFGNCTRIMVYERLIDISGTVDWPKDMKQYPPETVNAKALSKEDLTKIIKCWQEWWNDYGFYAVNGLMPKGVDINIGPMMYKKPPMLSENNDMYGMWI